MFFFAVFFVKNLFPLWFEGVFQKICIFTKKPIFLHCVVHTVATAGINACGEHRSMSQSSVGDYGVFDESGKVVKIRTPFLFGKGSWLDDIFIKIC